LVGAGRKQRHARFLCLDFFGNSDDHAMSLRQNILSV
jgi:hypothetical protein